MPGILAALWLLGLFAAAPLLRTDARYEFAGRLRDALVLGIAIPFALGLIHALYPFVCWCALAMCVALAQARRRQESAPRQSREPLPYLVIGALVAVTWPQLMRPLLDGDSLSYHLPNAASWVQAHSLWTTATRYWWYPPASELFAAGLDTVGGPFPIPWAGFGALALLGFRIVASVRELYGAPPILADALGAATITVFPLAIQGATMQNDVWLAAFFVESLAALRTPAAASTAMRTLAVTALVKPQGWLFALVALVAGRARRTVWLAALAAFAIWIARDAVLLPAATLSPAATAHGELFGSTIVAHGAPAFGLLARVVAVTSPFALLALLAALLGPLVARREPRLGWAACASAFIFFLLPFGYATTVAQLATGGSLRFAAPAIAIGAVLLGRLTRRTPAIATALLVVSTLYGVWYVLAIFWNDGGTHAAPAFAILAVAVAAIAQAQRIAWLNAVAFGLGVMISTHLAARHPLDYYNDALRVGPDSPGVYRWIATTRPPAVGGWGLRLGVVNVLSPSTYTADLPDGEACAQARRNALVLVAVAQNDLPFFANTLRLQEARACGHALFSDRIGIAAHP